MIGPKIQPNPDPYMERRVPHLRRAWWTDEWLCHFPDDRGLIDLTGFGKTPAQAYRSLAARLHWFDCPDLIELLTLE